MQHDFLLLDSSGSMDGPIWKEALSSINTYVKKLAEDGVDTGVTLVTFNSNDPFKIIRDRITPKTWRDVTDADTKPTSGTPLNDATGKLLDLAERGSPFGGQYSRVAIVIMTDGQENASQEYPAHRSGTEKIKARLDKVRAKDWQVVFLGANFDNAAQASSYGNLASASATMSAGNMAEATRSLATKRGAYGVSGQSITMTDEEKAEWAKPKA